jgi:tRNA(fMet)-specific endonuclease VapC
MIIDTNVYSGISRGNRNILMALSGRGVIHLSSVVVAELKYGFVGGNIYEQNIKELHRFIARDSVVLLDVVNGTTDYYAEVALYSKKHGRALSDNDIWIAALAMQHRIPLLTCDKDFAGIADLLGDLLVLVE